MESDGLFPHYVEERETLHDNADAGVGGAAGGWMGYPPACSRKRVHDMHAPHIFQIPSHGPDPSIFSSERCAPRWIAAESCEVLERLHKKLALTELCISSVPVTSSFDFPASAARMHQESTEHERNARMVKPALLSSKHNTWASHYGHFGDSSSIVLVNDFCLKK